MYFLHLGVKGCGRDPHMIAWQVAVLSDFSLSSASLIHWSLLISTPFTLSEFTAAKQRERQQSQQ